MHLTAPSNWSRSIGTGGRDPSEQVVTIAGMRSQLESGLPGPCPLAGQGLYVGPLRGGYRIVDAGRGVGKGVKSAKEGTVD